MGLGCGIPTSFKIKTSQKMLPWQQLLLDTPKTLSALDPLGKHIKKIR